MWQALWQLTWGEGGGALAGGRGAGPKTGGKGGGGLWRETRILKIRTKNTHNFVQKSAQNRLGFRTVSVAIF
jgi:hypothetical protein